MNLTVYVPKDLEAELKRRASDAGTTPSLFAQSLLRAAMAQQPTSFSPAFAALAGSWEDERTPEEIIEDINAQRTSRQRPGLR